MNKTILIQFILLPISLLLIHCSSLDFQELSPPDNLTNSNTATTNQGTNQTPSNSITTQPVNGSTTVTPTSTTSSITSSSTTDTPTVTESKLQNGQTCQNPEDCDSGNCNNTICCEDGKTCCKDLNATQCQEGYTCNVEQFICRETCENEQGHCKENFHCDNTECLANLSNGLDCDENSDCTSGHCDIDGLEICCSDNGTCCKTQSDCTEDSNKPICSDADKTCKKCDATESECGTQYGTDGLPVCHPDGKCVECIKHEHCRLSDSPDTENYPDFLKSPVGSCSPDNKCTCYVPPTEDPKVWKCDDFSSDTSLHCPAGYTCGLDYGSHLVCLRNCDNENDPATTHGIKCSVNDIWKPAAETSCFAFSQVGVLCGGDASKCRLFSNDAEGYCRNNTYCTFTCLVDWPPETTWCPSGVCGDSSSQYTCEEASE